MFAGRHSENYEAAELKFSAKQMEILLAVKVLLVTILELLKSFVKIFLPPKPESLKNQLALVTGGGNGLGKALCMRLAKEKCDIAIVDIDIKNAKKTALEVEEKFQVQCRAYQCDISDCISVATLKNTIENEMRAVDILVNNAGIIYAGSFVSSDIKDIQRVVDVNFTSHLMVILE